MPGVGAVAQQGAQHATIGREILEFHADQLAQPLFETLGVFQCRFDLRLHLGAGALVEIHDDGVLGGVIIVGRAGGHAGLLGDIAHGGGVEPLLPEEFQGGIENPAAGLFGFRRRLGRRHIFERVQDQYERGGMWCQELF